MTATRWRCLFPLVAGPVLPPGDWLSGWSRFDCPLSAIRLGFGGIRSLSRQLGSLADTLIFLWGGLEDANGDTLLQDVLTWGANGSIVTSR